MNAADGTGQTRLTFGISTIDLEPSWSPDGTKIAFSRSSEINVMNADGTGMTALTIAGGINPTWSHDGTRIAFERGYYGDVLVINAADGTGEADLSQSSSDREPGWSPDGTKIAFTTYRDGNYEIYTMNPDGTEQKRLTNNAISDREPSWQSRTLPSGTVPPVAVCGSDKLKCENVASPVSFNASASYDPDGAIISYNWDFGDGINGTGVTPVHKYSTYRWNGTAYQPFTVNLTVTDNGGMKNSTSGKVVIWIAGDANGDGKVNILDASIIGLKWNSNPADPCADLNNDGKVNILDASIIGLNWGKIPIIQ
jgi:Tol biopolymer transport system component